MQGFVFIGYDKRRLFDSSVVWIDDDTLCRVLRFFEVAPCCHPDCKSEFVAEVLRSEMKTVRNAPYSGKTARMRRNQEVEYVSVASIMPQVVILIPIITSVPASRAQRRVADRTISCA